MKQSGLLPLKNDRRDFDLLATRQHKLAGLTSLQLSYSVRDATQRIPNQQVEDRSFNPPCPELPFGCTDVAQATICSFEDGFLHNPMDLENVTHANANRGVDMRTSLSATTRVWAGHPAYFRVYNQLGMDMFDAVRLGMLATSNEKRAVSIGTPFFWEWHSPDPATGILRVPSFDLKSLGTTWHDWVVSGWDTFNDKPYLECIALQGQGYGKDGITYMSREVFNALMAIPGTGAFTVDKIMPGEKVQTIGSPVLQEIINFIKSLL
jgi:hypothetical protein